MFFKFLINLPYLFVRLYNGVKNLINLKYIFITFNQIQEINKSILSLKNYVYNKKDICCESPDKLLYLVFKLSDPYLITSILQYLPLSKNFTLSQIFKIYKLNYPSFMLEHDGFCIQVRTLNDISHLLCKKEYYKIIKQKLIQIFPDLKGLRNLTNVIKLDLNSKNIYSFPEINLDQIINIYKLLGVKVEVEEPINKLISEYFYFEIKTKLIVIYLCLIKLKKLPIKEIQIRRAYYLSETQIIELRDMNEYLVTLSNGITGNLVFVYNFCSHAKYALYVANSLIEFYQNKQIYAEGFYISEVSNTQYTEAEQYYELILQRYIFREISIKLTYYLDNI